MVDLKTERAVRVAAAKAGVALTETEEAPRGRAKKKIEELYCVNANESSVVRAEADSDRARDVRLTF